MLLQSQDPWNKKRYEKGTKSFKALSNLKLFKPAHLQSRQSVTAHEEALESSQLQLGRHRAAQAQVPQVPANTKYKYNI